MVYFNLEMIKKGLLIAIPFFASVEFNFKTNSFAYFLNPGILKDEKG